MHQMQRFRASYGLNNDDMGRFKEHLLYATDPMTAERKFMNALKATKMAPGMGAKYWLEIVGDSDDPPYWAEFEMGMAV